MYKMNNPLQHYAWGSPTALTERYGVENPHQRPIAEIWMGAHPINSSSIEVNGKRHTLFELIKQNPNAMLGPAVTARFGDELPFLFKILAAEQPLSIQVHPAKLAAEAGFARESAAGIDLYAANRNYKDSNHKPELVYALTPFRAMNGFRDFSEMATLLAPVKQAHHSIPAFIQQPNSDQLKILFASLLSLTGDEQTHALSVLKQAVNQQHGSAWDTISKLTEYYPNDNGLFSPLLLNVIELQPGEAMFLLAETPHAYLSGVALEVMASSDNVLRAGLTPKHIDVAELLDCVRFTAMPYENLLTAPVHHTKTQDFPVPVDDFVFNVHTLGRVPQELDQKSGTILFCIEGQAVIANHQQQLSLSAGESCFIAASEPPYTISGTGLLSRIFNQLD